MSGVSVLCSRARYGINCIPPEAQIQPDGICLVLTVVLWKRRLFGSPCKVSMGLPGRVGPWKRIHRQGQEEIEDAPRIRRSIKTW